MSTTASVSFSTENLNIGSCVLLTNGFIGIIKYIGNIDINNNNADDFYGIELFDKHPNGHNGSINDKKYFDVEHDEHGLFVSRNEIATNLDENDDGNNHHKYTLNLDNNQDIIYFPTYSELTSIQNREQMLITCGYSRDTHKYIPYDILSAVIHFHYFLKIGDLIKLNNGSIGNIWCVGKSILTRNKLYYGVKIVRDVGNELNHFIPIQNVAKILTDDGGLEVGLKIKANDKDATIKYIGKVGDIPKLIGVEFEHESDKPLNGHMGKGYFDCIIHKHINKNFGYFVHQKDISPSPQIEIANLPQYVKGCYTNHPQKQFQYTQRIRKLLSIERDPPITAVIQTGIVPRLVEFISNEFDDYPRLQFEAAWSLTNIASGTADHTSFVIRNGAIPHLVRLLKSPSTDVQEQSIWCLGNISSDGADIRDLVLSHGALDNLLPILSQINNIEMQQTQITLLRNATWALSNFVRNKPSPKLEYIKKALSGLNIMIHCQDQDILQDSCWALSYISDIDYADSEEHEKIDIMIRNGIIDQLVVLLSHDSAHVRHPALRTLGNISTGSDHHTQSAINCGLLQKLGTILVMDRDPIKRECCWLLSNICAGSSQQIEAIITNNLIPTLIMLLKTAKYDIAKEALWALSNATSCGTDEQIKFIVNQGFIGPLCEFCKSNSNAKATRVAIEAIENVLNVGKKMQERRSSLRNQYAVFIEESGGIEILESLKRDMSLPSETYESVKRIIRQHFDGKEQREEHKRLGQLKQMFVIPNLNNSYDQSIPNPYDELAKKKREQDEDKEEDSDLSDIDDEDQDDDLMIITKGKDKIENKKIPDSYVCFKCKQVGKHWIMNCDQDENEENKSNDITYYKTNV